MDDLLRQIHELEPEIVVDYLGLDYRKKGKNISILCPEHDDKHFGSCMLTRNGYKCYACGARGDVISLVQHINGTGFKDSVKFICEEILNIKYESNQTRKTSKRVLNNELLTMIGLAPSGFNNCICETKYITDEDVEFENGEMVFWEPRFFGHEATSTNIFKRVSDSRPAGYNVVLEIVDKNPLQTLLNEDEQAYNRLVSEKAKEALEKYKSIEAMAINPAAYYDETDIRQFIVANHYNDVAIKVGHVNFIKYIRSLQKKCQNILWEYGTERREPPTSGRKSIFGKIKNGVTL